MANYNCLMFLKSSSALRLIEMSWNLQCAWLQCSETCQFTNATRWCIVCIAATRCTSFLTWCFPGARNEWKITLWVWHALIQRTAAAAATLCQTQTHCENGDRICVDSCGNVNETEWGYHQPVQVELTWASSYWCNFSLRLTKCGVISSQIVGLNWALHIQQQQRNTGIK